ncbi:MAG: hypothetical protein ABI837_02095 [Acidobacteriota bacterium]
MSLPQPDPQSDAMSRESLIGALRAELVSRADGRSICTMAAEKGIFCGGFKRFTDAELRERFGWIACKRPNASRADIENIADGWQLARQDVLEVETACDVQSKEHDLCNGWDDFSNEDLAGFYQELTGHEVRVVASGSGQPAR